MEKDREEFERWAKDDGLDVSKLDGIDYYSSRTSAAKRAWQSRQPEIDALKTEVHNLHNKLIDAIWTRQARDAEITKQQEENAALKAEIQLAQASERKAAENNVKLIEENLQLRRDAGRYSWLRNHILYFGEEIMYVDDENLPGCARYITTEECDEAIDAAMKEEK